MAACATCSQSLIKELDNGYVRRRESALRNHAILRYYEERKEMQMSGIAIKKTASGDLAIKERTAELVERGAVARFFYGK